MKKKFTVPKCLSLYDEQINRPSSDAHSTMRTIVIFAIEQQMFATLIAPQRFGGNRLDQQSSRISEDSFSTPLSRLLPSNQIDCVDRAA